MGVRGNNKNVDFSKLNRELEKRGLNPTSASIQMGRSSSYLGGMKQKGYLPETTIILFDSIWNIKYDDIAPTVIETPKADEKSSTIADETVAISKDELRYIITEAIKDAFVWYANY